ncbi:MAG: hypothetical protein V7K48_28545 [Nostoc sp.]|uniref:hypothetical protein n=1 Tax=Nostoc sp. TaxID=1180 RepID=UPI002FF518CA
MDGNSYSAEVVSKLFLREIWQQIEQQLQPSSVIFTVPVSAFERYLDWFHNLGDKLNIPAVQIVDESTAAALGYAVKHPGILMTRHKHQHPTLIALIFPTSGCWNLIIKLSS